MLCGRCRHELNYKTWCIAYLSSANRWLVGNFCYLCMNAMLSNLSVSQLLAGLERAGWTQESLPEPPARA